MQALLNSQDQKYPAKGASKNKIIEAAIQPTNTFQMVLRVFFFIMLWLSLASIP